MSLVLTCDVLVVALLCCIASTQVSCDETQLFVVNNNGTIVTKDTRVLNEIAVILFIQCVCLTNTSTCSTKANPVTSSGAIQQSTPCNIIDVESSDITYRKSSGILTYCSREDSRSFVTFLNSINCPNRCLVISFPRIDITLPIIDFVNASKQCTDFRSKVSSLTTSVAPKSTDIIQITSTASISSTPPTIAAKSTTTITQENSTTVSSKAAGDIPNLTVIIACSILGILAVIIITSVVVIIKRRRSNKRILVNSDKRTPLAFGSGHDGTYNRPSQGHELNDDVHTYKHVQSSSYAYQNPAASTNMDYSLPNQAGISYNHKTSTTKPISLLPRQDVDEAYIEIIDDSMSCQGKLQEYLGIYDKPEETYRNGSISLYAPVVRSPVTSDGPGHQYLSLKVSDNDDYYIDAVSVEKF